MRAESVVSGGQWVSQEPPNDPTRCLAIFRQPPITRWEVDPMIRSVLPSTNQCGIARPQPAGHYRRELDPRRTSYRHVYSPDTSRHLSPSHVTAVRAQVRTQQTNPPSKTAKHAGPNSSPRHALPPAIAGGASPATKSPKQHPIHS